MKHRGYDARSRVSMITYINNFFKLFEENGFWKRLFLSPRDYILDETKHEHYAMEELKEACSWLERISETELTSVLRIWKMAPRIKWDRYDTWFAGTKFQEKTLLNRELKLLRKALVHPSRPTIFKRKVKNDGPSKSEKQGREPSEDSSRISDSTS